MSTTLPILEYPAVEITSTTPCAGKTHLLYRVTALAVLPSTYHSTALHGKASAIVVLDTDARFDVLRLAELMMQHVTRQLQVAVANPPDVAQDQQQAYTPTAADIQSLIHSSLSHIHILRPSSFSSLLATLKTLPSYLLRESAHRSSDRRLHAILLDSATAFYWSRRAEAESARLAALDRPRQSEAGDEGRQNAGSGAGYEELGRELRTLSLRFGCALVITSNATAPIKQSRGFGMPRAAEGGSGVWSVLSHPWPGLTTLRVLVGREVVGKFAPALSADEAVARRAERMQMVERGRFVIGVEGYARTDRQDGEEVEVEVGGMVFVFQGL